MSAGGFLAGLLDEAHKRGDKARDEQGKARDEEVAMYRDAAKQALQQGDTERAQIALKKIDELYKLPKGKSPFGKLGEFLQKVGQKKNEGQQGTAQPEGAKPDAGGGGQPGAGAAASPAQAKNLPAMESGQPQASAPAGPGKQTGNLITRGLEKAARGLGTGLSAVSNTLSPKLEGLPPLDARAFPTGGGPRQEASDKELGQIEGLRKGMEAAGFDKAEIKKVLQSKFGGKPHLTTKEEPDPQSPTGYAWVTRDVVTGEEASREANALPPRSLVPSETDTTSRDPFGNVSTTRSKRTPLVAGEAPQTGVQGATGPAGTGKPGGPGKAATSAGSPQSGGPRSGLPGNPKIPHALDADGHIPSGVANPQVTEAANQLLDGTDKDKLPMKAREPAAALARSFGWEQGKFTPKEQVMLREATTFLQKAVSDPSLAALDAPLSDRLQLGQVLANPDREGLLGRGLSTLSATNMDPTQAAFVQMYNQLVGTISGLAQLVRSGRATEATIERLKAELPNPVTTKNSADGRKRLQRLLEEIDVAMKKGAFEGTGSPASSGKTAKSPAGKPKPLSGSPSKSLDDEIMEAVHGQPSQR